MHAATWDASIKKFSRNYKFVFFAIIKHFLIFLKFFVWVWYIMVRFARIMQKKEAF